MAAPGAGPTVAASQWVPRIVGGGPVRSRPRRSGTEAAAPRPSLREVALEAAAAASASEWPRVRACVADFADASACLGLCRSWREAALQRVSSLRVDFRAPLHVIVRAVEQRAALRYLDFCGSEAICDDKALEGFGKLFQERPVKLQAMRFTGVSGLSKLSRRTLCQTGVLRWAFPASFIEPGAVLISRPGIAGAAGQPQIVRAVVLILHHGDTGTYGLTLNRQTKLHMADVGRELAQAPWSPGCDSCPCHFGGDATFSVSNIHGSKELGGMAVAEGIFVGQSKADFARASDFVRWKRMKAEDFQWFQGFAHWLPGELAYDLKEGRWQALHCDRAFILPNGNSDKDLWADLHFMTS